jgi:predicted ATP-grasp superfamily ATP-dependent carboligase
MEAAPKSQRVALNALERAPSGSASAFRERIPASDRGVLVVGGAHAALAVVRSLGRHGVRVRFLGHDHPVARFSRYLTGHHRYSGPLHGSALAEIEALCDAEGLQGWLLMPCADAEALLFAENQARLRSRFRLLMPSAETLRLLNEKANLYPYAESLGIPIPRRIDMNSPAPIPFPVAIKPSTRRRNNAFTLAKAWRADTVEDLKVKYAKAMALAGDDGAIVQELIPGDGHAQFSYAAVWDGSGPVASIVARRLRQYPVDFGATSTFVETAENREVEALAERLLSALNYRGLVEVEFKYDERERRYKLLDVNTRPWTWIGLGAQCGTDFAMAAWNLAFDEPQRRTRPTRHTAWMHFLRDFAAAVALWRNGQLTAGDYLRSLMRLPTFAAMSASDPLPGLMDIPIVIPRLISRYRRNREVALEFGNVSARQDTGSGEVRDDLPAAEWDRLATEFADATFEQFGAFRGPQWGEDRLRRIAVFRDGHVAALALATVFTLPGLDRGLAYVKFGPLWRRKDRQPTPTDAKAAAAALEQYFVRRRKLALTILPTADLGGGALLDRELMALGFTRTPADDAARYVVDVRLPEDKQLASLGQKWRYNLKHALKAGLTVSFEQTPEAVTSFNQLFSEMEARKSYRNESWKALYPAIRDGKTAAGNVSTVLVRAEDGSPVAGAVIGHIGDTAYYLFGATGDRALRLKAGYAMQWWIIAWLRARGVNWYDLGGAAREPGLRQFKEGLSGKAGRVAMISGEFSHCISPVSGLLAWGVIKARRLKQAMKRRGAG